MSRSRNSRRGTKSARAQSYCHDCGNHGCEWCDDRKRIAERARIANLAMRAHARAIEASGVCPECSDGADPCACCPACPLCGVHYSVPLDSERNWVKADR